MKTALKLAALGIASLAVTGGVVPAHASSVAITNGSSNAISGSNTYTYGNTTFVFSACSVLCGGGYSIIGIMNGRGGTEIEVTGPSSTIFSTSANAAVSPNPSLAFALTVGLNTGNKGLSSITNIVSGSAFASSNNQYIGSTLSGFTETSTGITVGGTATSTLATNSQVTTLSPRVNSINSVTFTDTLNINTSSASGIGSLKLTNVALLLNPAPEPASIAVFSTGLLGLAGIRRRFWSRAKR
jgi:hypothetical protein